ncbi:MAG: hypothetical protein NT027_02520, partial [Proteobacteria bacterium]|nr:hypothetical protein [Pseudomonadota bacterium]
MAVKSTKIETPITDIMRGLGFSQTRKRQHVLWNAYSKDGSSKIAINERRESFFLDHFDVAIATENIEQSIQDGLKKTWGKSTKLYYDLQQDGSLQFVVEWQKERDPTAETYDENTTPSLISWVVRISKHTSDVTIFFQDIHLLGKSFPPNWFIEISKCSIIGILGKSSKHLECISMFEYQIDSATLAFTKLFPKISNEDLRILKENTTFEKDLELGLSCLENEGSATISDRQLVFYGHRKGSDDSQLSPNYSGKFSSIEYLPPSIEVLESRATPDLVRFFDQRLLSGKLPKIGLDSFGNAIRTRLDIAMLKGFSLFSPQDALPQLTSIEQEATPKGYNSINISYKLHQNFFAETPSDEIIDNLSQWYSSFSDAFSNHVRFESPTSVFIEHLGDAYKNQYPEQAAKAYLEALNQHEKPRILKKLATTYCGLRKTEDELKIQLRRLHCERRQPDLSSIRERLAELWISKNQSKLASNMLDILIESKVTPKESWIQTSLQISKLGDSRLALDLLTRIGNNLNQKQNDIASIEKSKKINLEIIVAIATIWVTDLNNPQNALYQLRKIIENSPSLSLDRIVFAEESLTTIGLIDEAFASRWKRWLSMPVDQKSRQLKLAQSIFDHLKTKDPSQLHLDVLKELIILGYKPLGLLEELHHWQTCEMKWNQFISEINRHVGTIEFNHLELIELSA